MPIAPRLCNGDEPADSKRWGMLLAYFWLLLSLSRSWISLRAQSLQSPGNTVSFSVVPVFPQEPPFDERAISCQLPARCSWLQGHIFCSFPISDHPIPICLPEQGQDQSPYCLLVPNTVYSTACGHKGIMTSSLFNVRACPWVQVCVCVRLRLEHLLNENMTWFHCSFPWKCTSLSGLASFSLLIAKMSNLAVFLLLPHCSEHTVLRKWWLTTVLYKHLCLWSWQNVTGKSLKDITGHVIVHQRTIWLSRKVFAYDFTQAWF